jgi:hypothetical protein
MSSIMLGLVTPDAKVGWLSVSSIMLGLVTPDAKVG